MPSFDVVSEVDTHEVTNAVDQANREISTRFDFKDTGAKFVLKDNDITLTAPSDFQVKQMIDTLKNKMTSRHIDIQCLDLGTPEVSLHETRQTVKIKQGIEQEMAKKIVKMIKETNIKVQTAIQGEKLRVTGKKRDDLQEVIAFLKQAKINLPLQFDNFRD
ncbi:MAG: YajQ family cyclic di-GMP-binding protein [Proteobacteria bacterium]|nr:YajQ family cyclic di-GMP-binding protein [Pseudomonadota bacterium]